jgi:hypothetical protein
VRRKVLALALVLVVGLVLGLAWLPGLRVAHYLRRIDEDPALAQIALRRLGVPAILPLAREVTPHFDERPMTWPHFRRARILEELTRDHPRETVGLARHPETDPDVARVLATLSCAALEVEELWDLLAYWVQTESPWAEEVLSWLRIRVQERLRAEALKRARGPEGPMQKAGALALALECDAVGVHEILRQLCQTLSRESWYERAVGALLEHPVVEDLPLVRESLLGSHPGLRREALWGIHRLPSPERLELLMQAILQIQDPFRRECFATLVDLLPEDEEPPGPVQRGLESLLQDHDAGLRADALWLLYPEGNLTAEVARQVTGGLTPEEVVESRLYYFLEEEELFEVSRALASSDSTEGEQLYAEVVLSCFPPLRSNRLLALLEAASPRNRSTTIRALTRLGLQVAGQLLEHCRRDPALVDATALSLLGQPPVLEALGENGRQRLGQVLWQVVDPDAPANLAVYVEDDLRQAAGQVASRLGGEPGRRILEALISVTEGSERATYQGLLQGLDLR